MHSVNGGASGVGSSTGFIVGGLWILVWLFLGLWDCAVVVVIWFWRIALGVVWLVVVYFFEVCDWVFWYGSQIVVFWFCDVVLYDMAWFGCCLMFDLLAGVQIFCCQWFAFWLVCV